jgi:predicted dehydrogenase
MLKIGLVGWGYWGRNYAKYFDASLDAQLSMVCDLREDMLLDAKQLYPYVQTTTDIKDLAKAKLDGVILASPASVHHKLASYFIQEHIPLLIEKPLTNSYETAIELEALAKKEQVKILVGHTFLYNQSVRFLKKEIDKGTFGHLYYLEFRRQSYGPIRDDVNIIWDFAPHDVAIANYLLGVSYPQSVYAEAGKFSRNEKEDIAIITLRYPGNVLVNINVGWLYPIKIRTCTLLGDKKMAVFEDTNINEPVKIYDTSLSYPKEDEPVGASFRLGDILIPRIPVKDPLCTELHHFIEYLKNQEKPITPIEDGVTNVAILEVINESAKTGKEIAMSEWTQKNAS